MRNTGKPCPHFFPHIGGEARKKGVGTAMSSTASSSTSVSDFSSWWDWIPDWLLDYNSFEETENVNFFSIGIVAGYTLAISFLLWLYWTCECLQLGCIGAWFGKCSEVVLAAASMGFERAKRRDFAPARSRDHVQKTSTPRGTPEGKAFILRTRRRWE